MAESSAIYAMTYGGITSLMHFPDILINCKSRGSPCDYRISLTHARARAHTERERERIDVHVRVCNVCLREYTRTEMPWKTHELDTWQDKYGKCVIFMSRDSFCSYISSGESIFMRINSLKFFFAMFARALSSSCRLQISFTLHLHHRHISYNLYSWRYPVN